MSHMWHLYSQTGGKLGGTIILVLNLPRISLRIWPNSQIPECTYSIYHNAPFRTEMCTFLFWMEHCGVWSRCILGFVKLVYCYGYNLQLCWRYHSLPLSQQTVRCILWVQLVYYRCQCFMVHLWVIIGLENGLSPCHYSNCCWYIIRSHGMIL